METEDVAMEPESTSTVKYVIKWDGTKQPLDPEKVKRRIEALAEGLNSKYIDFDIIVFKVMAGVFDNVTTVDLDELAA